MGHIDRFGNEFDGLLRAAQRGSPSALGTFFTTLAPVVAGYLRLQGAIEADDLTSEVFVAVLRNIGTFEGDEAGFRSWVFTIAHRRLLDERRKLGRRPAVEPLADEMDLAAVDDVEAAVDYSLSTDWVRSVCEHLAPDQRDVLLLRLLGRLTIDEVAEVVGKTPGAVKALQRRGLRAAGRLLDREGVPL